MPYRRRHGRFHPMRHQDSSYSSVSKATKCAGIEHSEHEIDDCRSCKSSMKRARLYNAEEQDSIMLSIDGIAAMEHIRGSVARKRSQQSGKNSTPIQSDENV